MSQKVRVYHNPGCSKCRLTMEILDDKGVDTSVIEYLNTPPNHDELNEMLDLLGVEPREIMRKHEAPYRENGLDDPGLSREQLIQAMIEHPILMERPIIINGNKATIGRPPEKVLDIL
ncbi:MAG TPA: arsenate reductase (glutaredoxin) [Gammaproteobacteria bacterium]|nr:arsenate reductase (glutaredoxin) [Gammaproteobacteria bacterium]